MTAAVEAWVSIDDIVALPSVARESISRWIAAPIIPELEAGRRSKVELPDADESAHPGTSCKDEREARGPRERETNAGSFNPPSSALRASGSFPTSSRKSPGSYAVTSTNRVRAREFSQDLAAFVAHAMTIIEDARPRGSRIGNSDVVLPRWYIVPVIVGCVHRTETRDELGAHAIAPALASVQERPTLCASRSNVWHLRSSVQTYLARRAAIHGEGLRTRFVWNPTRESTATVLLEVGAEEIRFESERDRCIDEAIVELPRDNEATKSKRPLEGRKP